MGPSGFTTVRLQTRRCALSIACSLRLPASPPARYEAGSQGDPVLVLKQRATKDGCHSDHGAQSPSKAGLPSPKRARTGAVPSRRRVPTGQPSKSSSGSGMVSGTPSVSIVGLTDRAAVSDSSSSASVRRRITRRNTPAIWVAVEDRRPSARLVVSKQIVDSGGAGPVVEAGHRKGLPCAAPGPRRPGSG